MPFSYKFTPSLSAGQKFRLESVLALKSAVVCFILGLLGMIFDRLTGVDSHLSALIVIGAIYLIMSIGRWQDARRAGKSSSRKPEPGH